MLDIELIRSDPEFVRAALLKRVDDVDLGPILEADALRRKLATEVDGARSERNRRAKEIGELKASGADTADATSGPRPAGRKPTKSSAPGGRGPTSGTSPSMGIYKEVSSASWAGDYQARRANIRYRPENGKPTAYVHTLNASGLATSRLLPAIVEQNQQPDGTVIIPEPLRPWLGTDILRPQR
jgi:seryl-tRNA synthetase